jgi:hypothetical protein
MSYRTSFQPVAAAEVEDRQQVNRFRRGGEDLLISIIILAELVRERLGGQRGKEFVRILAEITAKTVARTLEIEDKRRDLFVRFSDPIREPALRHFVGRKRDRAMIGTETIEAALRDRDRILRRERKEAQDILRRRIELNAETQAANYFGVSNYIILGQELRSQERLSQNDVAMPARLEELAEKEDDDIQ